MSALALPVILILFASFFQGSFGIGMKYMRPLAWEAWWLIYAVVAMVLFPLAWAWIVVPGLWDAIAATDSEVLMKAMLFGFLWGIGGIMFGVSVQYVGVSITYGIVMGLAATMGSLIPLLRLEHAGADPAFPYVLTGILLLLVGVIISAIAAIRRDRLLAGSGSSIPQGKLGKGLTIAILSGVLSSLLNVGFAEAVPVASQASLHGAIERNASLAAWVVVLTGAFIMNFIYVIFLLIRNKSFASFSAPGAGKAYGWAILTGLFWFAALGVYGQGAALMGALGPVVGWPILLGLALIIGNIWAYRAGEWKQARRPFMIMLAGVAVLIIACIILGYANSRHHT